MGALDGVLVVDFSTLVPGPLATLFLAEAGAEVIKIERPEGDFARGYDRAAGGVSSYFAWLNRGKESIALDLRQPAMVTSSNAGRHRFRFPASRESPT